MEPSRKLGVCQPSNIPTDNTSQKGKKPGQGFNPCSQPAGRDGDPGHGQPVWTLNDEMGQTGVAQKSHAQVAHPAYLSIDKP